MSKIINIILFFIKKVILLLFIFLSIYPFLIIILISFFPDNELTNGFSNIPFHKLNVNNYLYVITNSNTELLHSFIFTFIVSLISSTLIVLFAFIFGFYISRSKKKYFNYPLLIALLIYSIPSIFFATYWKKENLEFLRLIITHINYLLPFTLLLSVNYYNYVPFAFDRQASMDGISTKYFVTHIISKYFKPVLCFLFLLVFTISFNDVLFSRFIATSEKYRFIGHYLIENYYNLDQSSYKYAELSSYGTIIIIILSVFTYYVIKKYQEHILNELKNNI